ncbi:transposase family protein [Saccharopolyspora sp. NPDC003752]
MLETLFPHLAQLRVDGVRAAGPVVRIEASTLAGRVACPGCGTLSDRVHSRYQRRLSDTAISSREVLIRLRVRRFFCDNTECAKKTFAEAVPELAARYGRRTTLLERVLCAVALALGVAPAPVGFQNWASGADLRFHAAGSYSLIKPPRTDVRLIRSWLRLGTGWSARGGWSW